MRRNRSISYYAKTEKEYLDICDESLNKESNSLSKRRRYKYSINNETFEINENKNEDNILKKKFNCYDDLEFDELGINSTYQIQNIENEEEKNDTEIELLKKISNINLSFKQKNKDNFIVNLMACSKNIINNFNSYEYHNKKNNNYNLFHKKRDRLNNEYKIKSFQLYNNEKKKFNRR